jgi:hypothetical protein
MSYTEEFILLKEYDPIVAQCYEEVLMLGDEMAEIFRTEVVNNRKAARQIADRLITTSLAEEQRSSNQFKSPALNEAYDNIKNLGTDAKEEFKKVVVLFGEDDVDLEFVLKNIRDKYTQVTEEKILAPENDEEGVPLSNYLCTNGWKPEWFDPTGRIAMIGTSVKGAFSGDNNCNYYEPYKKGIFSNKKLWHKKIFHDGITQMKIIEKERQGSSLFVDNVEGSSQYKIEYGEWYFYRLGDGPDRFILEHSKRGNERIVFFIAGLTYIDSILVK